MTQNGLYISVAILYNMDEHTLKCRNEAPAMYTKQDFADLTAQLKKRLVLLSLPSAVLLGGIAVSLYYRIQWLTTILTIVLGAMLMFCYIFLVSPVRAYRTHVEHALYGKVRKTAGRFKEMEESPLWREGLLLYPMIININDMKNEEDDRLFYFDARLPRPDWQPGQKLALTSYDKLVTHWEETAP